MDFDVPQCDALDLQIEEERILQRDEYLGNLVLDDRRLRLCSTGSFVGVVDKGIGWSEGISC